MAERLIVESRRTAVPWGLMPTIGAFILALVIAIIGEGAFQAAAVDLHKHHLLIWEMAAYQFLTAGVIVSASLLLLSHRGAGLAALGYRFPGWRALALAASSVVLVYLGVDVLLWFFTTFLPGYHLHGNATELIPKKHAPLPAVEQVVILLWAAVEVPFTEETLFRGILFQGVRDSLARRMPYQSAVLVGALVSGLLFGFVHNQPHTFPILAMLGIFLAYVFQIGRSIYASAIVHGIINGLAVAFLLHGA